MNVHPLIQCARGALSDEDIVEAERLLGLAVDRAKDLEEENARLKRERDEALALALVDEADWTQDHSRALNALVESRGASDEKLNDGETT